MLSELTDEKAKEVEAAFKVYDRDGDQHLNLSELRSAMRALALNPTEEELQQIMADVEEGQKGRIPREEFYRMITKKLKDFDPEEELVEAFKVFDADGSGYVLMSELKDAMAHLGETLFPEEIEEMKSEACPDDQGRVDYRKFVEVILKDQTPVLKA